MTDDDAQPSIYDLPEDAAAPQRRPAWPVSTDGVAALAAAAPLAQAEARLARLDERLAASPFAADAVARVALEEAAALARRAGWQGGPGRLARLAADRAGVAGQDDVRALWLWRELARPEPDDIAMAEPASVAERVSDGGWGGADAEDARDFLRGAAPALPTASLRRDRVARWLAAGRALPALGAVGTAAALHAAWGGGLRPDALAAAALAMRFGAGRSLRALRFVPLAAGAARHRPFDSTGTLPERAQRWAAAVEESAARHLMRLDRLAAWRTMAEGRVRSRLARRLLALLHAAPFVDSTGLARRLGVTPQYVNRALQALAAEGVAEETTGGTKYRLWRARLGG